MITIKFYNTPDENYVINKTKNDEITKSGTIKDDSSILTPTITIKKDLSLITKNYCYIEAFKRYYFITDILISGVEMVVSLKVDVLESYKEAILSSTQVITRHESQFNKYLIDSQIPVSSKIGTQIKKFGTSPFITNGSDVLDINKYFYVLQASNLDTAFD